MRKRQSGGRILFLMLAVAAGVGGCRKQALPGDDTDQIGAAVGEVMASVDEAAQGSTTTAMLPRPPVLRTPAALHGPAWRRAVDAVLPSAYAGACGASTFSSCDAGVRSRSFADCTLGVATLDGSVTLTFTRTAACALVSDADAVTRTADLTLTGPYGGTLEITSPGGGQTLTRTSNGFTFAVAGMRRVLTGAGGHTLWDVSTRTTAPLVITGSSRSDLVIASGTLEVSHNVGGYKVSLTPSNLTWTSSCNCAVSGSLTGTISGGGRLDGKSATIELTGCGEADVTIGTDTNSITLDRCASDAI
jgi:hypothetical protein